MILGRFKKDSEGSFRGEVRTIAFGAALHLIPLPDMESEKAPHFRVIDTTSNIDCGAAWQKKSNMPNRKAFSSTS